jgi:alkaline phosphatase/alkaline phosphatase D
MVGPDRASKTDNHTNHAGFRAEADSFFAWLQKKKIQNVLILCGDRHWQYHSIHPTGVEEFSVGALNDENSIKGIKPGDPQSTDPEGIVKQPFLCAEPSGGFLQVTANPDSSLLIAFHNDTGRIVHKVENQPANQKITSPHYESAIEITPHYQNRPPFEFSSPLVECKSPILFRAAGTIFN